MLTTSDFNKSLADSRRVGKRAIKLIPKEPVPSLDNLEILIFETGWTQGDMSIWGWEWSGGRMLRGSSLRNDGSPEQHYFNIDSAAGAAIKSAAYWSDEERIPREEKDRQDRDQKNAQLDKQVERFLASE